MVASVPNHRRIAEHVRRSNASDGAITSDSASTGLRSLGTWLEKAEPGVCWVVVDDKPTASAVGTHIGRVARALNRVWVNVDTGWVDCGIRHVLRSFGVTTPVREPQIAAKELARAVGRAIVVFAAGIPSSFDRVCLDLFSKTACDAQFVVVSENEDTTLSRHEFHVASRPSDLACWWAAVLRDMKQGPPLTVGRAEARWSGKLVERGEDPTALDACRLLDAIHASRTIWPRSALRKMAPGPYESLHGQGWLTDVGDFVEVRRVWKRSSTKRVSSELPHAMLDAMPADPWVQMRAAVLLLEAGDVDEAEQLAGHVMRLPSNQVLRADFWRIWQDAIARVATSDPVGSTEKAAELALELEDGPAADVLAERVCRMGEATSFEVPWILGRAQLLRADAQAARVSLECAVERATDESVRGWVRAHLAEACLMDGDHEAASREAQGVGHQDQERARLMARNVLGKLILASGTAKDAEHHFAQDEVEAQRLGLEREWLRARLNRAVALISQSHCDRAAVLLEDVLEAANKRGDVRAQCKAHLNLAVAAHKQRDYEVALEHYEMAMQLSRSAGDHVANHNIAQNLAELRAMFGMIDEAWQSLQFVCRTAPDGITAARRVGLSLVSARIQLDRGDTTAALVDVAEAIALSHKASLRSLAGDCHRLSARIALREGDIRQARRAITAAEQSPADTSERGENELLRAHLARATGSDAIEHASKAKELAIAANDEVLLLEVFIVLSQIALAEGNCEQANKQARAAAAIRDRNASRVAGAVRRAYLNRPESRTIELLLADTEDSSDPPPVSHRKASLPGKRPFIGEHPRILDLLTKAKRVAMSDAPVLIRGESGTGKELIAESVHHSSPRREGPFVAVNCAALVETLLLSELFGHERGAFTGAAARKLGRFENAHGGTLFLDEIGDISPGAQVALLRVLQSHTFHRVGGTMPISCDVRVVCATHRDLDTMVASGEFRQDLFFRLCGVQLDVPPLRERGHDAVALAQHVLDSMGLQDGARSKRLTAAARRAIRRHNWPGNVRELENVIRAAAILTDTEHIDESDLVEHIQPSWPRAPAQPHSTLCEVGSDADFVRAVYAIMREHDISLPDLKRQIEEGCIALAMDDANGKITSAASFLGMKRPRVSQLVKAYGLKFENKES